MHLYCLFLPHRPRFHVCSHSCRCHRQLAHGYLHIYKRDSTSYCYKCVPAYRGNGYGYHTGYPYIKSDSASNRAEHRHEPYPFRSSDDRKPCNRFRYTSIGVNLFVASSLTDVPVMRIAKKAAPMIGYFLLALLILTFVPAISLFLL